MSYEAVASNDYGLVDQPNMNINQENANFVLVWRQAKDLLDKVMGHFPYISSAFVAHSWLSIFSF